MRWDSRNTILTNLKSANTRGPQAPSLDMPFETKSPTQDQVTDALGHDVRETLEGLSVVVEFHKDHRGIESFIARILEENSVHTCVAWRHPLLDRLKIPHIFRQRNVQYRDSFEDEEDFRAYCARADLGITSADAIIEESGTLVLRANSGWERSTSLLPPTYLAIVQADGVVSTVRELPALLRSWSTHDQGLPSAVHLVTGPSRTADIEFNLVLGVHGPKKVYMLVKQ